MNKNQQKRIRHDRRKQGIRKRVQGTPRKPRLTVYRSLNHIYAQLIDDLSGHTLVAADSRQQKLQSGGNVEGARQIGQVLAQRATGEGIKKVVFDRNGFRYHGRVRAVADAARDGGLEF